MSATIFRRLLSACVALTVLASWVSAQISMNWQRYPPTGINPHKRAFLSGDVDEVNKRFIIYGGGVIKLVTTASNIQFCVMF
jgi:hypothetical protein